MVSHLKDYPWSSYPVFGGYAEAPEWLETSWLLSLIGKKRNLVRDVAIYLSREITGESSVSLGRHFGGISGSAVTLRHKHVADRMGRDRNLRRRIDRVRKRIINN